MKEQSAEPTFDERAYIKKSWLKSNKETLAAIKELDEDHGTRCISIDDFWKQMEMNPEA